VLVVMNDKMMGKFDTTEWKEEATTAALEGK